MTTPDESTPPPNPPARRFAIPPGVSRGFKALEIRNFRLYWFGQVVSLTGTWMQTTAQAWLVLQLTQSAFAIGLVTTLQFLPVTLLALYGGVLADRLPKQKTVIITQILSLIQAFIFGLLVVTHSIQLWHVYILAVTQGIITAIDNPVRQAFAVELVGREDYLNAVALNSMSFNGARVLGPAIAGIAIAQFGVAPALFFNAFSFIAVIYALVIMDPAMMYTIPPSATGSVIQRLREGLDYTVHTPQVLVIIIAIAAIGTFGYNFSVIIPLLSDFVLHTDAAGFGILNAFLGLGSLISAIGTAYTSNVTMRRLLISGAIFGTLLAFVAITPFFAVSATMLMIIGFCGIIFMTTSSTLLQLLVPGELRGRVLSLNVLLVVGSTPVGGFLIGVLSQTLSVGVALFVCAVLCLLGIAAAAIYHQRVVKPSLVE